MSGIKRIKKNKSRRTFRKHSLMITQRKDLLRGLIRTNPYAIQNMTCLLSHFHQQNMNIFSHRQNGDLNIFLRVLYTIREPDFGRPKVNNATCLKYNFIV